MPGGGGLYSEQELDRWVADAKAKAERYQAMQDEVASVSVTESSADGVVTVTVDAGGTVTDLVITDRSRELSGSRLASLVLSTMRRAQSRIPARVAEIMSSTVGDDTETVATVVGNYQNKFPEPPPEEEPRRGWSPAELTFGEVEEGPQEPASPAEHPQQRHRPARGNDEDDGWENQSFLR